MEMGREHEIVYEGVSEPAAVQPRGVTGSAKGAGSNPRGGVSTAGTSAPPKESEQIDTSAVSVREALGKFIKREEASKKKAAEAVGGQPGGALNNRPAASAAGGAAAGSLGGSRRHLGSPGPLDRKLPEQRLKRLQGEVSELLSLAAGLAARDGYTSEFGAGPPRRVAEELAALQQRLRGPAQGAARSDAGKDVSISRPSSLSEAALGALDRLAGGMVQQEGEEKESQSQSAYLASSPALRNGPSDSMTWEIFYAPSIHAISDSAQIAQLENSIAEIEKKLGVTGGAKGAPTVPFADLQTALTQLHRRLSLLDTHKMESVRGGIAKAMSSLDAALLSEQRGEGQTSNNSSSSSKDQQVVEKRLSEMYESCHLWTPTASALPAIVSRLQSLQTLHQQSAAFTTRLSALEHQQDELAKLLEVTNAAVHELGKGLQENMVVMTENLRNLEDKLSRLPQK